MAKTTTIKPVLALSIMVPDQLFQPQGTARGFQHGEGDFQLYPVTIGRRPGDYEGENVQPDTIRSVDRYSALNSLWLESMTVHAYFRSPATGREVWGWNVWFKPFAIDSANDALKISGTFAKIEKRMDQIREINGHPSTFPEDVSHVAQAIGCTRIVLRSRDRHVADRIVTLGEGIDTLRHYIRTWQAAGQPVAVAVAQ